MVPIAAAGGQWVEETEDSTSLDAKSILVVEDQALIAMDTEQTLRSLGATSVRVAPSVREALQVLASFIPDVAVLDFVLDDGTAEDVAKALSALNVPFVFATGYSDNVMIPALFKHVPVVQKPFSADGLAGQINRVIKGRI